MISRTGLQMAQVEAPHIKLEAGIRGCLFFSQGEDSPATVQCFFSPRTVCVEPADTALCQHVWRRCTSLCYTPASPLFVVAAVNRTYQDHNLHSRTAQHTRGTPHNLLHEQSHNITLGLSIWNYELRYIEENQTVDSWFDTTAKKTSQTPGTEY